MAGAESLSRLDLDCQIVRPHLVPIMRAMHDEPPCPHRLQPLERLGDPVDIGNDFLLDGETGKCGSKQGADAFAELLLLLGHQIDGSFPDVALLIHLGGSNRDILFTEIVRHEIEDFTGLDFGRGDIKADFAHGGCFLWLRLL